jgi:superfamily II DNA/RNA helicase
MLHKSLTKHGFSSGALHGDLAQSLRFSTLEKFKNGDIKLLVCSDVAARGIDIGGLSHVFNFDVPIHAEDYVHRIGRTGRAGRTGHAYSIATPDDRGFVEAIEKLIGNSIPLLEVEGIQTAVWAEGGGRRGRGRRKPAEVRRETQPVAEPGAFKAAEPASAKTPDAMSAKSGARTERKPDGRGERRPERQQDRKPERAPERQAEPVERGFDPRRESRHRPDDLGPPVIGFGGEVPAFMLLPTRKGRVEPIDTLRDDSDLDVG